MPGETLSVGTEDSTLEQMIGAWETFETETIIRFITSHIKSHMIDLKAGAYDHILPALSILHLVEYNEELLQGFEQADLGGMSKEAIIARFYACINEENDYMNGVRLAGRSTDLKSFS